MRALCQELRNLLSCHYKTYGKGIHIPVVTSLRYNEVNKDCDTQVPALKICCTEKSFLKNIDPINIHLQSLCLHFHVATLRGSFVHLIETVSFILFCGYEKVTAGQELLFHLAHVMLQCFPAQSNISSLLLPMKSFRKGIINS